MALTRFDVEQMNQSFGDLAQNILRERQTRAQEGIEKATLGMRERELENQVSRNQWEMNPQNPVNREATARATVAEDAAKKYGVTQIESSWTTADGQTINMKGTQDELKEAAAQNPPAPTSKITSRFVTKDGVEHTMTGTADQLKAQQETVAQAGGGIQTGGYEQYTDPETGQQSNVYVDRRGTPHIIREQSDGTVTTETGTRDPVTGQISVTSVRSPVRHTLPPAGAPGASATAIPDQKAVGKQSGKEQTWRYTGKATTLPEAKKDASNWVVVQ
jgi:hypothetical protein